MSSMVWTPGVCVLVTSYFSIVLLLTVYGAHRGFLVMSCLRRRLPPAPMGTALPRVTVQLPLYNEAAVAERLLLACAALDYPRALLQIQVLDDSSDETTAIVGAVCARLSKDGLDIRHVRRGTRTGYKAGALAHGLSSATGELCAIFDADFVPSPDFLRQLVGHFADGAVACVQARWGHLNRRHSLFTEVQAMMLDGHHLVENRARAANGHLFNFSGTGGIWRVSAIADAGGWQHDTLVEDLDLSYRAQLRGWRLVYRPDVVAPAELPEEMSAYRAQQFRWAKGTVQSARKLLGRVWRSTRLGLGQKIEASFHLTPHFASPLLLALAILLLPTLALLPGADPWALALVDLPLMICTTGSLALFYVHAERFQGRPGLGALRRLPALMALGAGMTPWVTQAVFAGLGSVAGEFVRTPKRGTGPRRTESAPWPVAELALAVASAASTVAAVLNGHWFAAPFAGLFTLGYGWVVVLLLTERSMACRPGSMPGRVEWDRKAHEATGAGALDLCSTSRRGGADGHGR